jgi:YD repeat-containing protein
VPYWNRKTLLFSLLVICLLILTAIIVTLRRDRETERAAAVKVVLSRLESNGDVARLLGIPIRVESGVTGDVSHDETGWKEAHLTLLVRGPQDEAKVHVIGGQAVGPWVFTTYEVIVEKQHKKVDLISGKVVEYDPKSYVEIHTEATVHPEYNRTAAASPRSDGTYPCVFAPVVGGSVAPSLGRCAMPTIHAGEIDRFEVDLRYGAFVLRQSDLRLNDVFDMPLTRSYDSEDWVARNRVHAFGRNSNHPYDVAPLGSRNPYTYQMLALEDGDLLYFDRISKGTGYADAVFQHTETSTRFYKATTSWNGHGWTTKLADGSEFRFPESYNAKNLAQGAATELRDAMGNKLELQRDPQRNLQEILTPHGHWIKFTYDDQARITKAEDDSGKWVKYGYNSYGMLISATNSSGQERHYEYQDALMTAIGDEHSRILLRNRYRSGVLASQQYANGDLYEYSYTWNAKRQYAEKVLITLPDGNVHEVWVADAVPEYLKMQ